MILGEAEQGGEIGRTERVSFASSATDMEELVEAWDFPGN